MKNREVSKIILIFFMWASAFFYGGNKVVAEPSQIKLVLGELSTATVGPFLKAFAANQSSPLPGEVEVEGKKHGYKYRAVARDLEFANLFTNMPNDEYSVVFGPNGEVLFRAHLPSAKMSGMLRLKAHEKGGGGLFGGMFSDLGKIRRKYSLDLVGLDVEVLVRIGLVGNQIRALSSEIKSLEFDQTKVKLRDEDDGLGASFADALSGGEISHMVKKLIVQQLQGRQISNSLTGPVAKLVEQLTIPASLIFNSPLGIKAEGHVVDMQTDQGLVTQLINVEWDGPAPADRGEELTSLPIPQGEKPKTDELSVLMPMGFIADMVGELGRGGMFSYSGQKFGVNFEVSVSDKITARPVEGTGEIQWLVPIGIDVASSLVSGKVRGMVSIKVKPHLDPENGVVFQLVDTKLENLEAGSSALGPMIPMIKGTAEKILSEHVAAAFPKASLVPATLPLGSEIDLALTDVSVDGNAVKIQGTLRGKENILQSNTTDTVEPQPQPRAQPQGRVCANILKLDGTLAPRRSGSKWIRTIYLK